MDELAAEAGISKRTLYRYFRSKDELIEATLDKFMLEVTENFEHFLSTHPEQDEFESYLPEILYHVGYTIGNPLILEDLRQYYPHYWQKIDDFRVEKAKLVIKAIIDAGKGNTKGLDARIVTNAVLASVQSVVNPKFIISNGLTLEETIRQLLKFFKFGLLGEE